MARHADLSSIHPFAYVASADPGAVGAGKGWVDTSGASPVLKVRNAGDTGWDAIGGAGGGALTVREVDGTPSVAATALEVPNGQLTNPSGTIARLDAAPTVHPHAAAGVTFAPSGGLAATDVQSAILEVHTGATAHTIQANSTPLAQRGNLNFVPGASGITVTDDAVNNQTDVDFSAVGALTVREVDGTPSVAATALEVPNGQLTNPSGTIARLDAAPTVHTHAAADVTSGVLAVARLATGTPNGTKFVRDDGTLAVPAGTNPMTTQDDLVVGGAAGAPARLGKGTSAQVLTVDSGTGHLAWANPAAGGTTVVGLAPFAFPVCFVETGAATLTTILAAGAVLLVAMDVPAALALDGVTVRNVDSTLTRGWDWALYREPAGGGGTLDRVAASVGPESFTASGASNRTIAAASAPVALGPGVYWLAVKNTDGTAGFSVGGAAVGAGSAGMQPNRGQSKSASPPALGATLDAVSGTWSKQNSHYALRLNGRVFGVAAAY